MIIAGSGHRPGKLGGYSKKARDLLVKIAEDWLKVHPEVDTVISGMALGWDQALAIAAIKTGKKLTAAVPFSGQEKIWPKESQEIYRRILDQADEVLIISEGGYSPEKLQARNEWMVDHTDLILAMWDGSRSGTERCIKYAQAKNIPVVNLYDKWSRYRGRR